MYIHLKSITYNLLTYLLENKSLLKEKEMTLKSLEKSSWEMVKPSTEITLDVL